MEKERIISIEDRIPKLKEARKKKSNRRLIIYLVIFLILLFILVYLQTPLSEVKHIEVEGNQVLSEEEVIEAGEVEYDTNIWSVSKKKTVNSLQENPVIDSVKVERKLPQTLRIQLKENRVIGYLEEEDLFYPVLDNGTIVENREGNQGAGPVLRDFKNDEYLKDISSELKDTPDNIYKLISEITWSPTDKNKNKIKIYMSDGYVIDATIRDLASKLENYPSIVSQLDEDEEGIIHMGVGTYFEKTDK
ncbi:MAG TPA: FtsQ-type POTRA domain-containing protein [Pseudogracilibacillus sp.]|nr:FtsQ-type POTRA domain-containing protein [Pseudogracilibacillus sp.]